jgi:hypothetical protein
MKMFHSAFWLTIANPVFICPECLSVILWTTNGHVPLTTDKEIEEHGMKKIVRDFKLKVGRK